MTDLATLAIRVQALEVDQANKKLGTLTQTGKKAEHQLGDIERQSKGTDRATGQLGKSVGGVIAKYASIGAAAIAIQKLASASLKAAAAVETQATSLGVLLGDVELGRGLYEELQDFAARTPLAVDSLSEAAQKLMSFGIEAGDVTDTLQMLGDASLGNAQKLDSLSRAYGRVQAKGKASMEEINMAMEAGLPIIAELATQMGVAEKEVFDLAAQGKVSSETFQAAFEAMTSEGGQFNDGMEILSQTFNGKLSTAMDNIKLLGATMFEPAIERGKKLLDTATGIAQSLAESIDMGRVDRQISRGEIDQSDLSSEDQLRLARYRLQQKINEQQQLMNAGLLDSSALSALQSRLDTVDGALERLRDGAQSAGNIIQNEIEKALERVSESEPPPWFESLEFGFLDSESGLEKRLGQEIDQINRLAEVSESLGWDYDAVGEKIGVYRDAIEQLLMVDPTEFGGDWEEAYKLADPSIQNLIEELRKLEQQARETAESAGNPNTPDMFQRELEPPTSSGGTNDTQGVTDYIEALQTKNETLYMSSNALIEYEMRALGASEAEIELAQNINTTTESLELLKSGLDVAAEAAATMYVEAFSALGEALASGASGASSMKDALREVAIDYVNMLPMMMTMAGLQLLIYQPHLWPIALGLIVGGGAAAVGAGAANYSRGQQQTANAHGNIFDHGSVVPFASGGVVTSPKIFPMANGTGLMGEAGPEAIMPLKRLPSGDLGVQASSGSVSAHVQVIVNNYAKEDVTQKERTGSDGKRVVEVTVGSIVKRHLAEGKLDSEMSARYGIKRKGVR